MPKIEKQYEEKIVVDKDGTVISSQVIETEVEVPTDEEIIAEKEAKLLEMYAELQALKDNI